MTLGQYVTTITVMEHLASKKCIPCENPGIPRLTKIEAKALNKKVVGWLIEEKNGHLLISKSFKFRDFKEALEFVNKVADIAEAEGHHPNIYVVYNKVRLDIYTHVIKGLHENDFIIAAKIDKL